MGNVPPSSTEIHESRRMGDDRRPSLKSPADMIIYEMHHRDMSVDSTSGIKNKGKYLALTEQGTMKSRQVSDRYRPSDRTGSDTCTSSSFF